MSDEYELKNAGQGEPSLYALDPYQRALDFIDSLRSRGVLHFKGLDIDVTLDPHFSNTPVAVPVQAKPETIDIGGGVHVDRDLLGHET